MEKDRKIILYVLISMVISFGCFFNQMELYSGQFNIRAPFTIDLFVLGLITYLFFKMYQKWYTHKLNWVKIVFVLFLSIWMLLGESLLRVGSLDALFGSSLLLVITFIRWIGYIGLFYILLVKIDDVLRLDKKEKKISSKFLLYFDKHPIKTSFIILFLCWSIYMIAFYPIILSPDPSYQLLQFFNLPTKYLTYVIPLSSKVHLTNHHPVLHTMLLGGFLKIGCFFGNDNLGLFFYSIFQTLLLMSALVGTIVILKKENVSIRTRFILLMIYSFVPMFPLYAMSGVKDTLYTTFMIFYVLYLYEITKGEIHFKWYHWFIFLLNMFLLSLFRNNGVYVILLSMPFIILYQKKVRKILLFLFVLFIFGFFAYDKVLLPSLKITAGSKREMLSIPFQQTARLVKEHSNELDKKDKQKIDKVLGYKTLSKRYQPEISDPVKNEYNPYTTSEDLKSYFDVWWKYLKKYPDVYIEATLNNIYGYFYPGKTRWYLYTKYFPLIKEEKVVNYHYNSFENLRTVLSTYGNVFPYLPGIGLLSNIGFNSWILLFLCVYSLNKKNFPFVLCLLPLIISLLICIASPVNAYFRYAMPYIFIIPWCVSIFIEKQKTKSFN